MFLFGISLTPLKCEKGFYDTLPEDKNVCFYLRVVSISLNLVFIQFSNTMLILCLSDQST